MSCLIQSEQMPSFRSNYCVVFNLVLISFSIHFSISLYLTFLHHMADCRWILRWIDSTNSSQPSSRQEHQRLWYLSRRISEKPACCCPRGESTTDWDFLDDCSVSSIYAQCTRRRNSTPMCTRAIPSRRRTRRWWWWTRRRCLARCCCVWTGWLPLRPSLPRTSTISSCLFHTNPPQPILQVILPLLFHNYSCLHPIVAKLPR